MPVDTGAAGELPLTGERTGPGVPAENYWFRRHEIAYRVAADHCAGGVVLDAGAGEGYGAALLAATARRVIAVDDDPDAVAHARRRYPDLAVLRADLGALPVRAAGVDTLVSLQVVEHLTDQAGFLAECHRIVRPGGRLLVSTPNRITFSPGRDTPLNPFHTRELDPAELAALLRDTGWAVESLAGVRHGPRLRALDARFGGSLIDAQARVVLGFPPGAAVWPADLLAAVDSVRATDFAVTTDDLDGSLDLLARAVRR